MIEEKELTVHKEIAKQLKDLKTDTFYCLVPEDKEWVSPFQYAKNGREASWGVFTEGQNGYKWAEKRIPVFQLEQLEELAETDQKAFVLYNKLKKAKKSGTK